MAIWDIKERYELARGSKYLSNVNGSGRILYAYSGASSATSIQSLNITNGGTSTDFGEMTVVRGSAAGMSSTTRGVRAKGSGPDSNVIDYVTISTEGNAADFGDATVTVRDPNHGTIGNNTRGISMGGANPGKSNVIDFITFAHVGNATDFGDATTTRRSSAGASSKTRGLSAGGAVANDTIDFITMATTGNATDFGDLTEQNHSMSGNSNGRIATFGGMNSPGLKAIIDTVTISTTGNASDFGDLSVARGDSGDGCNSTKAAVIGGYLASEASNVIDIHIFATGGTATDYGDVPDATTPRNMGNPAHGGINLDDIQLPSVTYMPGSGRGIVQQVGTPSNSNVNYIDIPTLGNSIDFGDLTVARTYSGGVSSLTRAVAGGGSSPNLDNTIDAVEMAHLGNYSDFGNLSVTRSRPAGFGSTTRGCIAGGDTPSKSDVIDYITISSAGNATDFGNLTEARTDKPAGLSSPTRGVVAGGATGSDNEADVIDYVTISSTGNATDFGNLTVGRAYFNGVSSTTRGVYSSALSVPSGPYGGDVIDYITIASTGNATDFGDPTQNRYGAAGMSNSIRGVFAGGRLAPNNYNVIDFITIASVGNATDFGDLSNSGESANGVSDSHGALHG